MTNDNMGQSDTKPGTGIEGLDQVLNGIIAGDNIVWQVDTIDDYTPLVGPFCKFAASNGIKLNYFRFARHRQLVPDDCGAEIHVLDPLSGFENFITQIHDVIARNGPGGYYLFDCLSDLSADWFSDRMLGNFFTLTCQYLHEMETVAYFAVLRNCHSFHATTAITETTQIFSDVYTHAGQFYVHPIKVQGRYSPTQNMLHVRQGDDFVPVTESITITEVLAERPWSRLDSASQMRGFWNRTFAEAEALQAQIDAGQRSQADTSEFLSRLIGMIITRDRRIHELAMKYLSLKDVINIWRRMIGTGLIGGKSVGLILARAILERSNGRWKELLEPHDSFFIGSDVFYTFLVQNRIWWIRQQQRDPKHFLESAAEAQQRLLEGTFPEYILKQFGDVLDYFGQSPIIVRSSSLLEDNFGNAFAGKYESFFCANQGPREKRLEDFMSAVRKVYASSMSEKALVYRARRGLLEKDEQMALLIQRVSGAPYGSFYFPQAAGVAFSFNPYAWNEDIDPEAGLVRLVFGLGTRAVDRADDDYTRIVALNAPELRPESNLINVRQFSQKRVDVLNLKTNSLDSELFEAVAKSSEKLPVAIFASKDRAMEERAKASGVKEYFAWTLTFDNLLENTPFAADMRELLRVLEEAYDYPVDVEFALNFFGKDGYKLNLLQCRPLQLKSGNGNIKNLENQVKPGQIIFRSAGPIIGHSRIINVDRVIYVMPSVYGHLSDSQRYSIARLIGQLTHHESFAGKTIMLLGPGRWGTSTASLGIPVTFAQINNATVICEIVAMREDFVPDVSLGTHFFSDIIETEMLYIGFFPADAESVLAKTFFEESTNLLERLSTDNAQFANVVKVVDPQEHGKVLKLYSDAIKQKVIAYFE